MKTVEERAARAKEILEKIIYITIASVGEDGKPWNSPVYSAFDEGLNFYWASDREGQHSKNVRSNGDVFLVVYDSTAPEGTGEGVYFKAQAFELDDEEVIVQARKVTQSRKGKPAADDEAKKFTGDNIRRVYKAVPKRVWMNDVENDESGNYTRDIRVEIPLDLLRGTQ